MVFALTTTAAAGQLCTVLNPPHRTYLSGYVCSDQPSHFFPIDDGATNHLIGMTLPNISSKSTRGDSISLGSIQGNVVIYCYPMTGQPNAPLPEG
jgi:hypothetical protein